MYYALWDLQVHRYMGTGLNTQSLDELKECFLGYISVDFDDDETEEHYSKIPMEELAEMWEFEIQKQETPFEDEWELQRERYFEYEEEQEKHTPETYIKKLNERK